MFCDYLEKALKQLIWQDMYKFKGLFVTFLNVVHSPFPLAGFNLFNKRINLFVKSYINILNGKIIK